MTVARSASAVSLVSHTRLLREGCDPLAFLGRGGFAWLNEGAGFATSGVAARIPVGTGPDRLARAADEAADVLEGIEVDDPLRVPGTGPLAVGALPFSDDDHGELIVPARIVGVTRHGQAWMTEVGPPGSGAEEETANGLSGCGPPQPVHAEATQASRAAWSVAVRQALDRIAGGELTKVVLAREVVVDAGAPLEAAQVVAELRQAHPSCFTFASGDFVGASPELLIRRRGQWTWSRPMAGSIGRGQDPTEDDLHVAMLQSSAKELDEHRQVVDEVRACLRSACRDLHVSPPEVVRLSSVFHLATNVSGRLQPPAPSALALAGLLHPTPAVGGLPRAAALATIKELETFNRGAYAGPVGWVDRRGDGDWAVALRCARLDGSRARLAAGAGIVAGSEPDDEWAETEAKLEPMRRALARVQSP